MQLELINVGNGTKEYPGNFTKKEKQIIQKHCQGEIIHLFSGRSLIGDIRVDYACKEATHNQDVFQFLEENNEQYTTSLIDAPYRERDGDKYQKIGNTQKQFIIFANAKKTTYLFNLIREKINPDIIIIKSWNYYCPKDYELKERICLLCWRISKTYILIDSKAKI